MAVQAQYRSSLALNKLANNYSDLFASYTNPSGQHLFNATVFSEPESELTCNNMSASRKRNRQGFYTNPSSSPQMFHQQQQHHQHQQQFISIPKVVEKQRLNGSEATSTSGRSSGNSPFLLTSDANDLNSHLLHQNLDIEALILLQNEKLRSGLEETRKRHCRSLVSVLELQVMKRLEEKENELANANRRNAELEEKVKQMSAENQIWFNVAKNNEAIVSTLKSSLEQILIQNNQGQLREGFGDSDSVADDAQSCSSTSSTSIDAEKTIQENSELKRKKTCKVCQENEVSVLLLPCRHLCLCKDCESKVDSCPICNSLKNATVQIFLS